MLFVSQNSDHNYIENVFIMQNVLCAMSEMFNDAMKQLELLSSFCVFLWGVFVRNTVVLNWCCGQKMCPMALQVYSNNPKREEKTQGFASSILTQIYLSSG